MENGVNLASSFRDPSGFVFYQDGHLYRQINVVYKENYEHAVGSGFYKNLIQNCLLIPYEETDCSYTKDDCAYKVIRPEPIPFITYPYEWCFSQLKEAALLTLKIQKRALEFGMSLKDCSAYNIQFKKGRPIFIDTLSFERYRQGIPWVAYRQFCQHFLGPLTLMAYRDVRLNQLFRIFIDGIPLDLTSSLLPFRTHFRLSLCSHIHLHARSQKYFATRTITRRTHAMGRLSLLGLIDNLEATVQALRWRPKGSEWTGYYDGVSYSTSAFASKKKLLNDFLSRINPKSIWDFGANIGLFSRVASRKNIYTISFDYDPAVVEKNYLQCVEEAETNILPLVLDLTNPSPGIGWENKERQSLLERGPVDTVFAFALIHHLAISNNLPLRKIASFFNRICNSLVIEFIPKSDAMVKRLLSMREDVFSDYTQQAFEKEFTKFFKIQTSQKLTDSERTLYLMVKQ